MFVLIIDASFDLAVAPSFMKHYSSPPSDTPQMLDTPCCGLQAVEAYMSRLENPFLLFCYRYNCRYRYTHDLHARRFLLLIKLRNTSMRPLYRAPSLISQQQNDALVCLSIGRGSITFCTVCDVAKVNQQSQQASEPSDQRPKHRTLFENLPPRSLPSD